MHAASPPLESSHGVARLNVACVWEKSLPVSAARGESLSAAAAVPPRAGAVTATSSAAAAANAAPDADAAVADAAAAASAVSAGRVGRSAAASTAAEIGCCTPNVACPSPCGEPLDWRSIARKRLNAVCLGEKNLSSGLAGGSPSVGTTLLGSGTARTYVPSISAQEGTATRRGSRSAHLRCSSRLLGGRRGSAGHAAAAVAVAAAAPCTSNAAAAAATAASAIGSRAAAAVVMSRSDGDRAEVRSPEAVAGRSCGSIGTSSSASSIRVEAAARRCGWELPGGAALRCQGCGAMAPAPRVQKVPRARTQPTVAVRDHP